MTITLTKKKRNLQENSQKYHLKLFWNACTWHGLDDLIFYGQWNLHDRLQSGLTNAWIDWFQTFITHVNFNSILMWVTLPNKADWDCFKIQILLEILRTQNLLRVESYSFLELVHLFPRSWMGKKQTAVPHSSIESEIISLDARLRLDRITALDLWDLIVAVLGNTTQNHDRTGRPVVGTSEIFSPSHTTSQTQAISESDQWIG